MALLIFCVIFPLGIPIARRAVCLILLNPVLLGDRLLREKSGRRVNLSVPLNPISALTLTLLPEEERLLPEEERLLPEEERLLSEEERVAGAAGAWRRQLRCQRRQPGQCDFAGLLCQRRVCRRLAGKDAQCGLPGVCSRNLPGSDGILDLSGGPCPARKAGSESVFTGKSGA